MCARAKGKVVFLWIVTPMMAVTSGATLLIALLRDDWINTQERMTNETLWDFTVKKVFVLRAEAGLFHLCKTKPGSFDFSCSGIDLFPIESYITDSSDASTAIPYAVLQSAFFFLLSISLLLLSEIFLLVGLIIRKRRLMLLISGIAFIIAGLLLMLGAIVFIATLKGETVEKLKPKSSYDPPRFSYEYGWSFGLIIFSLFSQELTGVLVVFLYILWHKHEWSKKTYAEVHQVKHNKCPAKSDKYLKNSFMTHKCPGYHLKPLKQQTQFHSLPSLLYQPNKEEFGYPKKAKYWKEFSNPSPFADKYFNFGPARKLTKNSPDDTRGRTDYFDYKQSKFNHSRIMSGYGSLLRMPHRPKDCDLCNANAHSII